MDVHKTEALDRRSGRSSILSEKIQKSNGPSVGLKNQTRESASIVKGISVPSNTSKLQRSPSPVINGGSQLSSFLKRSQSAERRRPATPHRISPSPSSSPSPAKSRSSPISSPSSQPSTPAHDFTDEVGFTSRRRGSSRMPDGLWPSMRSLSASFQGEKLLSNSNHTHLEKLSSSATQKRERRRSLANEKNVGDQSENLKPSENSHSRVVPDQNRWPSSVNCKISTRSMSISVDLTERASRLNSSPATFRKASPNRKPNITDSIRRGPQKTREEVSVKSIERDSPSNRPRRTVSLPSTPSTTISSPSAFFRSMASPSATRPTTPSVCKSSMQSRSCWSAASPTQRRPSTPPGYPNGQTNFSSSQSFIVDARKGKKSVSHLEDAHQLKLLYSRDLQWRFVNARADALMSIQKLMAESILHSVWASISEMRQSAITKRICVKQLRQEMMLGSILREQMAYLEDWGLLDGDHSDSLSGVAEALRASILRIPVSDGAKADFPSLEGAINSAVGIMQLLCHSIDHLQLRMADKVSAVSELTELATLEITMLQECQELLSYVAALQVQESSLRTHLLQLRRDAIRLNPMLTVG